MIVIPLLLVLIVLFVHSMNVNSEALKTLRAKMDALLRETRQLKEEIKNLSRPAGVPETITKEEPKPEPKKEWKATPPPTSEPAQTEETFTPKIKKELKEVPAPRHEPMHVVRETWTQNWLINNTDIEKFI